MTDSGLRKVLDLVDTMVDEPHDNALRLGDTRDGAVYRTNLEIETALKVALITGRPILIVGPPGCGKSSLGRYVARNLGFEFLSYTVTEASEPADLLWSIDHVRRLNDAQVSDLKEMSAYMVHGVLWQAFDPSGHSAGASDAGTVILIDELDKADANFANSLLVALGSMEFEVPPVNKVVKAAADRLILTLFTSNGERTLPPAFLRRCITIQVDYPSTSELVEISSRHWPSWMNDEQFSQAVKKLASRLGKTDREVSQPVSTAEFLDLVQALRYFESTDERWDMVEQLVLLRSRV
jgi:MoxR-like ATPase